MTTSVVQRMGRQFLVCLAMLLATGMSGAQSKRGPCDAEHVGSVVTVRLSSSSVKSTCIGTNCKGVNTPVTYLSYQTASYGMFTCKSTWNEAEYDYDYSWVKDCEYGNERTQDCRPTRLPCPGCDKKHPSAYWTRPDISIVTDRNWDTCRGKVTNKQASSALESGKLALQQGLAGENASYADRLALFVRTAEIANACTATPVEALDLTAGAAN